MLGAVEVGWVQQVGVRGGFAYVCCCLSDFPLKTYQINTENQTPMSKYVISMYCLNICPNCVAAGSGSLAAMAIFEDKYKPDMEVRNALK